MAFLGHHIGAVMLTLSWLAAWAMAASLALQMSDLQVLGRGMHSQTSNGTQKKAVLGTCDVPWSWHPPHCCILEP